MEDFRYQSASIWTSSGRRLEDSLSNMNDPNCRIVDSVQEIILNVHFILSYNTILLSRNYI